MRDITLNDIDIPIFVTQEDNLDWRELRMDELYTCNRYLMYKMELPYELYQQIGQFSQVRDIVSLMESGRDMNIALQDEYFWNNILHRDFGFTLKNESIPMKKQYQLFNDVETYMFNIIDRSDRDNDTLQGILESLLVTGDDPYALIDILDDEYYSNYNSVYEAVESLYEVRDSIPYKFYMNDTVASYFSSHIMTIGKKNIREFTKNPIIFFIENIDLFGGKSIPRIKWNYNLSLYGNEGFWRNAIISLYEKALSK